MERRCLGCGIRPTIIDIASQESHFEEVLVVDPRLTITAVSRIEITVMDMTLRSRKS